MRIDLKYGHGYVPLELPDSVHVDVFEPNPVQPLADPLAALHAALDEPLGCQRLEDRPAPRSVAIAVPDETRP
ncbi:lactate racemase domain-containing protein, partial [Nitratidesulfovibrio liaohensis]|uniref:lactate racemase domain-containing protein n=1 Tax=Nitratidesulfovibrio liaohensis TaxID=2604158 RepID=UPI00141DE2D1